MPLGRELIALGISYVLGCCLTGYYLVRACTGKDIRQYGSGNAGATNVGRLLGAFGFWVTLFGDAAKGLLAVSIARTLSPASGIGLAAMFIAITGHVWPCQLGFRGGKGAATALGGLLGVDPRLGLLTVLLFGLVFALSRKRALSALVAIVLCPLLSLFLHASPGQQIGLWSVVLLLGFTHRVNLRSLIAPARRELPPRQEGD